MGAYAISRVASLVRANGDAEIDTFQLSEYVRLNVCSLLYPCVQVFK